MGVTRTALEWLARGKVVWRRLPEPYSIARVLVTPEASLRYLKVGSSWCDPELMRIVSQFVKKGDVVWDVGSNVGIFGVAAAVASGAGGRVLCVEPDVELVRLIRRTAQGLPEACARVETVAVAVSDKPGIAEFWIAERGRASNALAQADRPSKMGGVRERQLVPVVTLDDLLKVSPGPAVLKIDVEGAEGSIFDGGARVLSEARPVIYVEVSEANVGRVTERLKSAAYDLFDPTIALEGQSPIAECVWNTLAIPRKQ